MGKLGKPRMTARVKAMLVAYGGEARLNLTEAARLVGYKWPEREGWQVKQKWRREFEEVEEEYRNRLKVGGEEVEERLAELARNPKHKDHYKALELLARMHGKLSDKVHVTIDRKSLNSQLDELVALMVQSHALHSNTTVVAALTTPNTAPTVVELPATTPQGNQPS